MKSNSLNRAVKLLASFVLVFAVLAGGASASVNVSTSGWAWGNPTPQGRTLRAIAFQGGVGYAVGEGGTVLTTANAGSTWSGLTTGTSEEVERLQVLAPSTIVISGGSGCSTRISSNGGQTFTRIFNVAESNCPEPVAAISFVSPQLGYLLLSNGSLEMTSDGGQTFSRRTAVPGTPVSSGGGNLQAVAVHFISATTGIAIVNNPSSNASSAYVTPDGGVSWTQVSLPAGARVTSLDFLDSSNGYAVGPGTLLRTSDGGNTWTARPIAAGNSFNSIDCASVSECVLTVTSGNELVLTGDGGATQTVKTTSSSLIYGAAYASPGQIVAVGAGGATVVSDNGGGTFTPESADIGGEFGRLRSGPGGILLAPGSKGNIAISYDSGVSWHVIATQTSANLIDASFASPQIGYALDSGGGLQQTSNGGSSWQTLSAGGQPAKGVAAVGNAVLLIGPSGVRRAVGGGRFEPVTGSVAAGASLSDYDIAGSVVFAYGAGTHTLIRSTNSGGSWTKVRLPLTNRHGHTRVSIRSVAFTGASTGMLLDTAGRTWVTHNGGASWREVLATGTSSGIQLAFSDASHGYMTLSSFGADGGEAYVLRTEDGGQTWHPQAVTVGSISPDALVATSAQDAALLIDGFAPGGGALDRLLFATTTGGDVAGTPAALTLSTHSLRLTRRALRRSHGALVVNGTLAGALGGEQIVVSRRSASGGSWQHQVVVAGANGGSFTTTWHVGGSSVFVAQWAGDSGRPGLGSRPLTVNVR
jgi:photosystem II stability/assembly factor-like uncharacterized protein